MGFLDGIVKGLADMMPEEGNPELKAYKAQSEMKEVAAKEEAVFARLGRQLYADGGSEQYPAIKAELDALAAQRAEVETRIRTAQDETAAKKRAEASATVRRCPQCGAENPDGAFCRECGTRMEQPKRFCPQCGTEVSGGSRFCNECGTKMEDQP